MSLVVCSPAAVWKGARGKNVELGLSVGELHFKCSLKGFGCTPKVGMRSLHRKDVQTVSDTSGISEGLKTS